MLAFLKSFFNKSFAVVLMVITVVQSTNRMGTDDEIVISCQMMLSTFFKLGQNDGLINFLQAFQGLTRTKILEHFKEKEEEQSYQATEKLISLQLNMTYFVSILNTNGIRYDQCQIPEDWCQNEANNLLGEIPDFANIDQLPYGKPWRNAEQLYKCCMNHISKISNYFYSRKNINHELVMQVLYLHFSEDMMNYIDIMGKESRKQEPEEIKYHTYFLNRFAKPFYDCYVTLLMHNLGNLTGPYMSVPDFCMSEGSIIIKDFKGLGYAPFMSFIVSNQ